MAGRTFDLHLQLLDRQIVDADGRMAGKVDDVELEQSEDGAVYVTALLVGPIALGARLGGRFGRWVTTMAQHVAGESGRDPVRVSMSHVIEIDSSIVVNQTAEQLGLSSGDSWIAERIVGRLPGATHASE